MISGEDRGDDRRGCASRLTEIVYTSLTCYCIGLRKMTGGDGTIFYERLGLYKNTTYLFRKTSKKLRIDIRSSIHQPYVSFSQLSPRM